MIFLVRIKLFYFCGTYTCLSVHSIALQDRTNEDHSDDNSPDSEEDDTNKKNIRFEEGEVSSTRSMSDGSGKCLQMYFFYLSRTSIISIKITLFLIFRNCSVCIETVISDPNNVPLDHDIRLPRLLSTSKILRELKANPTVNTNKYLERDCKVYADPTDQTHISEYNKSKAWNSWFGWSNGNKSKGDNLVVRKFNEYGSTAPESKSVVQYESLKDITK